MDEEDGFSVRSAMLSQCNTNISVIHHKNWIGLSEEYNYIIWGLILAQQIAQTWTKHDVFSLVQLDIK